MIPGKKYRLKCKTYNHDLDLANSLANKMYGSSINDDFHVYDSYISKIDGEGIVLQLGIVSPLNNDLLCLVIRGETLERRKNNILYQIKIYANHTSNLRDMTEPDSILKLRHPNDNIEHLLLYMEEIRKNFMDTSYKDLIREKMILDNREIMYAIDSLP